MHKSVRKVMIGIFTSLLIVLTMVTTTYAWVGMLTYAYVNEFEINLQVQDKESDYNLYISPTGEKDSFAENIDNAGTTIIRKQILENMGYNVSTYSDSEINSIFLTRVRLTPVSPVVVYNSSNDEYSVDLSNFIEYDKNGSFKQSKSYFKFDLYLTLDSATGEITSDTNYLIDLYLDEIESSLKGESISGHIFNTMTYNKSFIDSIEYNSSVYKKITNDVDDDGNYELLTSTNITSDSSYSTRYAIEYYEGIPIDESYSSDAKPLRQTIYYNGTEYPLINKNGIYSFGNILSTDENVAIQEMNKVYNFDLEESYNKYAKNLNLCDFDTLCEVRKNDLLISSDNDMLCDDGTNTVGVKKLKLGIVNGVQYKVKVSVYFWYEGWDADSFAIIDNYSTTLNLKFSSNFDNNA